MQSSQHAVYDKIAQTLHWLVAFAVLFTTSLGIWASRIGPNHPDRAMFEFRETLLFWHKSVGVIVLILMLIRLEWALGHRRERPPLPDHMPAYERFLAKSVHYSFYAILFALPVSGIILSQSVGFPVSIFGIVTLPQIVPVDLSVPLPERPGVQLGILSNKIVLANLLYALLAIHFLGVAKHYFIDRDRTMIRRMWPGWRARTQPKE